MGEATAIEWTDHTFNPWFGCTKISPACDHCYAEAWAKRSGLVAWNGPPRRASHESWLQPVKWDRQARAEGVRRRVFCASLADVFDNQVPEQWRRDLWVLILMTPHLDWLLLTKRPQNIAGMLPARWDELTDSNVWLGTTAENQAEADRRIPHLLSIPARRRFLSCEPLLGPLDLRGIWTHCPTHDFPGGFCIGPCPDVRRIDLVIAGGESGPGARPTHPAWARGLRNQCRDARVPFFFKQWGDHAPADGRMRPIPSVWIDRDGTTRPGLTADMASGPTASGWVKMERVGKKAAGAMLDGREWREMPA